MNGFDSPAVLWLLLATQLLGVLSACLARLSEGSSCQAFGQCVFLAALPLMGAATGIALAVGTGIWLASAASLAVMVLMATCDLRVKREAAIW